MQEWEMQEYTAAVEKCRSGKSRSR